MRAVLFATGHCPSIDALNKRTPAPLLPLVDRPFVHHVVETLAAEGISHFDVVLSAQSERFQEALGDGSRWGVQFNYHAVPSAKEPDPCVRIERCWYRASCTDLPDLCDTLGHWKNGQARRFWRCVSWKHDPRPLI